MSLPRYPEYKDSGVEWLREIPSHWSVLQSRRMFAVRSEPALVTDKMLTASQKYGVLYQEDFIQREGRRVVEVILGVDSLKHVEPDDFIISMRSFQGGLEWSKLRGSTSFHYVMLRPIKHVWPPYFSHLFKSVPYIHALRRTTDLIRDGQELRYGNFVQIDLPIVPLEEQRAIAVFLDREISKIDALVLAQENLITLLAEKRQATIAHAVTKGLNPDAPMKDSGVEWLGAMPEHWNVSPIKYVARVGNGSTPNRDEPKYWSEGRYPWLNSSVVNQDKVTEADQFVTELALKECHLPIIVPPAVLVGITGQGRTRGMAATLLFEATINQHVVFIKPLSDDLNVDFLRRVFDMAYQYLRNESDSAGSTKGAITCHQVLRLTIPLPNIDEQAKIVSFLDDETARLDALSNEASRGIALLEERRSALISAAVTGKIDVRQAVFNEQITIQEAA